jgi:hypothetical protein
MTLEEEIIQTVLEKLAIVDQGLDEDEMEGLELLGEMQFELDSKLYDLAREYKLKRCHNEIHRTKT